MKRAIPTSEKPPGFAVSRDFLSTAEERELLERIEALPFAEVRMHGVAAKRTVAHFGWHYGYESWRIERTEPIPPWLLPLRERAAAWAGLEAETFEQCLVSRYPPGAGIGWHCDAPMFGPVVIGISLSAPSQLQLRGEQEGSMHVYKEELPPRSVYLLSGEARKAWQHRVPPVKALRHSLTFRTIKDPSRWEPRPDKE